jgi:hypothetical protein
MLEIERLDAAISRIDLALQRADSRRQALERRPDLDPELSRLIGQAIELAAL